jgi:2-methylcitrate dehydratase PrpD
MSSESSTTTDVAVHATPKLAAFASELTYSDLPAKVVDHVERLVIDTLGCALGGRQSPLGEISARFAASCGGAPVASVAGTELRVSAVQAAEANGRMAGALDADDTFAGAGQTSHHGSPTVAAVLALAEQRGATGAELITAVAAGYEVGARISASVPAHAPVPGGTAGFKVGGGSAGVMAPTVACARLLGLDAEMMSHAMGIAGAHVDAPPLKWFDGRVAPMVKSMDCGWNAAAGVTAAMLAQLGMTGHEDILDGDHGLWRALGQSGFATEVSAGSLGERWWILDASFKLWPCQYWMQSTMRAFAQVIDEHALSPSELERVVLRTNSRSASPRFLDQNPEGFVTAAFNFPHAVAMLALKVPAGPRWFTDEALQDPEVAALRRVVEVEIEPRTSATESLTVDRMLRRMPGSALVYARGAQFEAEVDAGFGGPWDADTRLSDSDLANKLTDMVAPLVEQDSRWAGRASSLWDLVGSLRDLEDVGDLGALLRTTA